MHPYRILRDHREVVEEGSRREEEAPGQDEDRVTLSRAEFEALRARAERDAPPSVRGDAFEAREAALVEDLAARGRQAAEWERAFKQALRDRELATALAGRPLVDGAAPQLIKLWREEFDVFEEGGAHKVAARDGRAVGRAVADWLASPEYAHFCRPSSRGGTLHPGVHRPSSGPVDAAPPRTLGDAALLHWREAASRDVSTPTPIGLRPRR